MLLFTPDDQRLLLHDKRERADRPALSQRRSINRLNGEGGASLRRDCQVGIEGRPGLSHQPLKSVEDREEDYHRRHRHTHRNKTHTRDDIDHRA